MTTLIAVYSSSGCKGRCDASCYDAKHEICTCICGGLNHGKGREEAVRNTKEMARTWFEDWCANRGLDPAKVRLEEYRQLELF